MPCGQLGYKWEWQNADRYARSFGATYELFGCYNDAEKLDMAVPLPQIHVIEEVRGDSDGLPRG